MKTIEIYKNDQKSTVPVREIEWLQIRPAEKERPSDYTFFVTWKSEISLFGKQLRKPGYYDKPLFLTDKRSNFVASSLKDYLKDRKTLFVKGTAPNEEIYIKPCVAIRVASETFFRYFDTQKDAEKYYQKLEQKLNKENILTFRTNG